MKSILLIGLGRFGRHIAEKLYELNHQILAIDKQEDRVEAVLPFVTSGQIGDSTNIEFLQSLGIGNFDVCIVAIDEVVYPEKQLANWTAIRYSSEHIFDYIQLSDDHAIFEISIPENWLGKTVGNIDIRKKYNITIMALKRDGKLEMSITPDTVLDKDATMLVLGASRDIQKCFHI